MNLLGSSLLYLEMFLNRNSQKVLILIKLGGLQSRGNWISKNNKNKIKFDMI